MRSASTPTTAFRAALTAKRAEAARAFAATGIRMANASALDVHRLTWTSPSTGAAMGVTWCPELTGPLADCNGTTVTITRPERFGWPPSPPSRGRRSRRCARSRNGGPSSWKPSPTPSRYSRQ